MRSTFQQVFDRIADESLFAPPIVITNSDFRFIVAEQTARMRRRSRHRPRTDAPRFRAGGRGRRESLARAAIPPPIALVLAADHVIARRGRFRRRACRERSGRGRRGRIVTFGINADLSGHQLRLHPAGRQTQWRRGALAVAAFVEKPDAATRRRLRRRTVICGTAAISCSAPTSCWPKLPASNRRSPPPPKRRSRALTHDSDFLRLPAEPFGQAPKKSIDYAVMERTELAPPCVPVDLRLVRRRQLERGLGRPRRMTPTAMRHRDRSVFHNSRNSLVRSDDMILTAVVGLDDVVVVTTPDAVLVTSRDKAEEVKGLVEQLKAQNRQQAIAASAHLPAVGLLSGRRHGLALSGQAHRREAERQAVAAKALPSRRALGRGARHRRGHRRRPTSTSSTKTNSTYIPIGSVHRLANPGKIPLELIEVQVGSYLGEDDIVRMDDVYGRE